MLRIATLFLVTFLFTVATPVLGGEGKKGCCPSNSEVKKECMKDCTKPCCAKKECKGEVKKECKTKDGHVKKECKGEANKACHKGDHAKAELSAQKTCPVMGGAINKNLYADVDGKRIYVCCGGCIAPIKKDPAKYIKILEEKGEGVEKL